eukprot:TRINITY_DN3894_c0_g1_i1.p1 TRINITY_DN3894_c0_g1~~TRINITY_DN3894_c0_g1_i1.p1  ORF type:complete len:370 (+),score=57.12 TRINITY_DN3894_c0_g1_i1:172-1281(+)
MFQSFHHTSAPSLTYGIRSKARCIASVHGEPDRNLFMIGSQSLKDDNEVHLIEVTNGTPEQSTINCLHIFPHPYEIWSISPSPTNPNLFFTVYNSGLEYKTSLWKITDKDSQSHSRLEQQVELTGHSGSIRDVLWDYHTPEQVVSLDENNIRLWQFTGAYQDPKPLKTFGGLQRLVTGVLNPNHPNQMATANDTAIKGWDFRQAVSTYTIGKAHASVVRDLDFNPNRPYVLASTSDDMTVKFWDIRNTQEPIKTLGSAHQHWIWTVKHNKLHDQLVLTSSSDNQVKLWNIASISSAMNSKDSQENQEDHRTMNKRIQEDSLIKAFEEHEESVYSVAWASESIWLFASLSYDGRVFIHHVPKDFADMLKY